MMIATQTLGIADVIPTVDAIVDSGWETVTYQDVLYDCFNARARLSKAQNVIAYYQKGYDKTPWFYAFG